MDTLIIAALALGATLRLSRLVVEDSITQPVRTWLESRAHQPGHTRPLTAFLAAVTDCVWCTSVWVAFGVLAPVYAFQGYPWWTYPLAALTVSWLTGIAHSWLDSPPPARHLHHHVADPVTVQDVRALTTGDLPGQSSTLSN